MQRLMSRFAVGSLLATLSSAAWAGSQLQGAGATFPYPLYSKWFSEFQKTAGGVEINYQSIGSGGGIRQLLAGTVDFGASDAPMTDEELAKAKSPVLHIPTALGAVVLSYNLPGVASGLKFTPEVIAELYQGKIQKWDDARIAAINPGIKLPSLAVISVYRSDGSGTTAIFTDYMAKVNPGFKAAVGSGKAVKWPTGLGGKGNEGVTGVIKQTPGAVGYVELVYAASNSLAVGQIKNSAGVFVSPSLEGVTAAAQGALKSMPKDFRVSITDASGKTAYPISSFTYLLVYRSGAAEKTATLKSLLGWCLKDGQKLASGLNYAPLPKAMVPSIEAAVKTIGTAN